MLFPLIYEEKSSLVFVSGYVTCGRTDCTDDHFKKWLRII